MFSIIVAAISFSNTHIQLAEAVGWLFTRDIHPMQLLLITTRILSMFEGKENKRPGNF
jgi:hypothetical protein